MTVDPFFDTIVVLREVRRKKISIWEASKNAVFQQDSSGLPLSSKLETQFCKTEFDCTVHHISRQHRSPRQVQIDFPLWGFLKILPMPSSSTGIHETLMTCFFAKNQLTRCFLQLLKSPFELKNCPTGLPVSFTLPRLHIGWRKSAPRTCAAVERGWPLMEAPISRSLSHWSAKRFQLIHIISHSDHINLWTDNYWSLYNYILWYLENTDWFMEKGRLRNRVNMNQFGICVFLFQAASMLKNVEQRCSEPSNASHFAIR